MIAMSVAFEDGMPTLTTGQMTVQLGDLVVAIYDEAAAYSAEPRVVARLATRAIKHLIWRGRRASRTGRRVRFC